MEWVRNELIPSFIALVLIGVSGYLWVSGQPLPDGLKVLTSTVVAFYYGGKVTAATASAVRTTAARINGNGGTEHG